MKETITWQKQRNRYGIVQFCHFWYKIYVLELLSQITILENTGIFKNFIYQNLDHVLQLLVHLCHYALGFFFGNAGLQKKKIQNKPPTVVL